MGRSEPGKLELARSRSLSVYKQCYSSRTSNNFARDDDNNNSLSNRLHAAVARFVFRNGRFVFREKKGTNLKALQGEKGTNIKTSPFDIDLRRRKISID
jgi:hypothetical protein